MIMDSLKEILMSTEISWQSALVRLLISFFISLLFATLGSILGFMMMFYIGSTVDKKVIQSGRFKYIPVNSIDKVETWFRKYGYLVIVANRFMPGTRAVISAFAWNVIMLYLGYIFGDNVEMVDQYLTTYSNIVIAVTAAVILFFVVRFFFRKRKSAP